MPVTKRSEPSSRLIEMVKPALVEAQLLTSKLAQDRRRLLQLACELHAIETRIAAAEDELHIEKAEPAALALEADTDVRWIHDKSNELNRRLGRIEDCRCRKPRVH